MIGTTISYICKRVNDHLRKVNNGETDGSSQPLADLVDGSQLDPLVLPLRSIRLLVVDVNENREFRDADRFQRRLNTDQPIKSESHYPDLHLEIGLLFIAKFKEYNVAWDQLSHVIGFFQQHPCFNSQNDQELPNGIGRLTAEFCPQSLQQINDLWSALKLPPHPALLYRFRLLAIRGPLLSEQPKPIEEVVTTFMPKTETAKPHTPSLAKTTTQ